MRHADRLFDILLALRAATRPVTAAMLADQLEVTTRTIYRDIATLQSRRIPIEGAAGIGYLLRRGFELPPLMFTLEETDAIAIGLRLLHRLRDPKLNDAANNVLAKITAVLPAPQRAGVTTPAFLVSEGDTATPEGIDISSIRHAIRENRKLQITYADANTHETTRTIWPIALAYYVDVTIIGAWCELRSDFRHFRAERIRAAVALDEHYETEGGALMQRWFALQAAPSAVRSAKASDRKQASSFSEEKEAKRLYPLARTKPTS